MKTKNYTTKINVIATLFVAFIILLSGCKKDNTLTPTNPNASKVFPNYSIPMDQAYSSEVTTDFMISTEQGLTKIGTIIIKDHSPGVMEVVYTLNMPWKLNSTRFFVGDLSQLPVTSEGNAVVNQFPYKQTLPLGGLSTSTILIQKSTILGCKSAAAQALVYNSATNSVEEDAWAIGTAISTSGDWGMHYSYCIGDVRPDVSFE